MVLKRIIQISRKRFKDSYGNCLEGRREWEVPTDHTLSCKRGSEVSVKRMNISIVIYSGEEVESRTGIRIGKLGF